MAIWREEILKSKMVEQTNNSVQGDQAGRDIIKPVFNYNSTPPSPIKALYEKFNDEKDKKIFDKILNDLQYFMDSADTENSTVIGLEAKLTNANFQAYLNHAMKTKEKFAKKLIKYQLYESSQTILMYILAFVYTSFQNHVFPIISNKDHYKSEAEFQSLVHSVIQEKIINTTSLYLEDNVLGLLSDEINGAVYFLTGNCHINWTS